MAISVGIDGEWATGVALLDEAGAAVVVGERPLHDRAARDVQKRLKMRRDRPIPRVSKELDRPMAPIAEPASTDAETPAPTARPALVRALVTVVVLAASAAAFALSDPGAVTAAPVVFGLLVASFLVLDVVRIDLFERAHISPASVPALALACVFGPFGPLAAETALAVKRAIQHDARIKWSFDWGSLVLAGAGAAVAFDALPHATPGATVLAALAAGLVYYAVNAATLSLIMALHEGERIVVIWRERLAWLAVHYVGFGLTAGAFVVIERDHGAYAVLFFAIPLLVLFVAEQQYVDRSRDSVAALRKHRDELAAANTRLGKALATNQDLMRSMQRSYLSTITSLARTIEAKDPYTGGHTERVRDFAVLLAREIGLCEEDVRAVEVGSIIHDIGKISIPDGILTKPGKLTDEEFDAMRQHPESGSYIVSELDLPPIVQHMVRSHHERWDGRGYPDGLVGEQIPLAARILSVADTVDAMTSNRSYRAALPVEVAVEEIRKLAGVQFCPTVAETFLRCFERDPSLGGAFSHESSVTVA
ncbi:MAG: putative metal-dependent phosphohydrolase [Solirubrobacterales bacterium]|nr:putative metal-dependent phosphohydrolase [Solirubrobacterales bacterium]